MSKILFIVDSLGIGGVEKVLKLILNYLSEKNNYKISVLVMNGKSNNNEIFSNNISFIYPNSKIKKYFGSIKEWIKEDKKLAIKEIIINIQKTIFNKKYKFASFKNKIRYYLIDEYLEINDNYDYAIAFNISHLLYILINKVNAKNKIVWFHGDATNKSIKLKEYSSLLNIVDNIVCVSNKSRKSIIKVFKNINIEKKCVVIKNLIDIDNLYNVRENNFYDKESINVLSIGRLSKEKNYLELVKIFGKTLKECQRKINLFIIGDGLEFNKIKKYIIKHKLEDNIKLLGKIEIPYNYIYNCDLYIQPSYYEGFCISLYEAMFLGKDTISFNIADYAEEQKLNINKIFICQEKNDVIDILKKYKKHKNEQNNLKLKNKCIKFNNKIKKDLIELLER